MVRLKKLIAGIGAKGAVLIKFLRPQKDRQQMWPVNNKLRLSDVEGSTNL